MKRVKLQEKHSMDRIKRKIIICVAFCFIVGTLIAYGGKPALLTQKMLDQAKGTFVVQKEYSAAGAVLYLPKQLKLIFDGGKIDNAELVGNYTKIQVNSQTPIFGKDIRILGLWDIEDAYDGWFEYEYGKDFLSNRLIQNMLSFSNDATFCHLHFEERDRVYYFEHPYKGDAMLGAMFTYHMEDGKKKIHYREIYDDNYAFLRVFTIPSNTKITLNNTWQMLPTNLGAYFVFWEYGKENVIIEGEGTIAGDNKEHLYTVPFSGKKSKYYGEWGFLFRCFKCKNFVFRGITLRDAFGDCLIYQGSHLDNDSGPRFADGLVMENVKIIGARRNGVALGARNVVIRNCHFEGCGTEAAKGTRPRAAIDFEPDGVREYPEIGNENVLMENCTFVDNWRDMATHFNNWKDYGQIATTIKDCIFTDTVKLGHSYWMRFENCYFPFLYNSEDPQSRLMHSQYMEFVNCEFGQWDGRIPATRTVAQNSYINCRFNTGKREPDNEISNPDNKKVIKVGKPKNN